MGKATRQAYGEALMELAKDNKNIVALDADLSGSTKSGMLKKVAPERFFNAGIAECNMMGMAAGLAASGKTVFASSFAMFATGRAFEVIRNSIAYPGLNVKVCASHAGLSVGEDGATHQTVEDISIMRSIPGMKVYVPCDEFETKAVINHIANEYGPCYVRLGRSNVENFYDENTKFEIGKASLLHQGQKVVIFATGLMVQEAEIARRALLEEGIDVSLVNVSCIKPLDVDGVVEIASKHDVCITVEEHSVIGGLYSAISETLINKHPMKVVPIGINDVFGESGKAKEVLNAYGLSAENIAKVVKENL